MTAILFSILWIVAAFKFADRNWQRYYPTLLFATLGNALYELLCYKYQLWQMEPDGLPFAMIPILLLTLIGMPLSTWIYLSKYPFSKSLYSQTGYIGLYILLFVILEWISVKVGAITYHHNWNLWWSLLFVIVMFIVLRIHYLRPLLAIIISVIAAVILCFIFDVSFYQMK
jgi:hypothetical protein